MTTQIGVVGVGTMGRLVAAALAAAGRPVTAYDADGAALTRLRGEAPGVEVAESVAEVAAACDVVVLSLPTPEVVSAVVAEIAASRGVTVLDTSTVGPDTSHEALATMVEVGGRYADTPVLGRPVAVGRWTIPVGGDASLVAVAADVLAPVAAKVVGVGPTGAAATLKVLNNLMLGVINAATAEVLVLAEEAGLDPVVFVETLVDSGAASVSGLFREVAPKAVRGDFEPTFSVRLMHKDNALALELAQRYGVPVEVARAAQAANLRALDAGLGEEDSIAVVKPLRRAVGGRG
ncbi:MAG: hypothetical protein JWO46_1286 [Nocardioidaceae bacterium]|nr:hypothetical protein [Nocardioidaceae bacterium]